MEQPEYKNQDVPYEYQMLRILRQYDKLVEENERLKEIIRKVDNICPIEELPGMSGEIQRVYYIKQVSLERKNLIKYFLHELNKCLRACGSLKNVNDKKEDIKDAFDIISAKIG